VGRPVREYKPTWLDKQFRRDLEARPQRERQQCLDLIAQLLSDLKECRHPVQDPQMQRWRPTAYGGIVKLKPGCHLAEYRLTRTMRVIACYFEGKPDILLVTATLTHDHERMKRLLKEHGRFLEESEP